MLYTFFAPLSTEKPRPQRDGGGKALLSRRIPLNIDLSTLKFKNSEKLFIFLFGDKKRAVAQSHGAQQGIFTYLLPEQNPAQCYPQKAAALSA